MKTSDFTMQCDQIRRHRVPKVAGGVSAHFCLVKTPSISIWDKKCKFFVKTQVFPSSLTRTQDGFSQRRFQPVGFGRLTSAGRLQPVGFGRLTSAGRFQPVGFSRSASAGVGFGRRRFRPVGFGRRWLRSLRTLHTTAKYKTIQHNTKQ